MMVPAWILDVVGHPCDSAALIISTKGHYGHVSALATSPSGHDDILLHLSDSFRCALPAGVATRPMVSGMLSCWALVRGSHKAHAMVSIALLAAAHHAQPVCAMPSSWPS